MHQPVLVTGGTGNLGRHVVPRLRAAGAEVRVLTRRPPGDGYRVGDLNTGEGVDAACAGVSTVVHLAGSQEGDDRRARVLAAAAHRAGVEHIVHVSVVGAGRMPVTSRADRRMFGYFAAKQAAEEAFASAAVPTTTLRATQFHDLMFSVVQALGRLPVVPVPWNVRFQPVDVDVVAARLVELALGPPQGLVPDLGGPEVHRLDDLVRSYLRATGRRRLLAPVPLPGGAAKALRDGANLLAGTGVAAGGGWDAFLAVRLGTTRKAPVGQRYS